jgi:6-phosphogluconate dehydrogenase
MTKKCDIGLAGLEVMGQNLVLNMEDHGYRVAVWNRTTGKMEAFVDEHCQGKNIEGCASLADMVALLEPPRKVMLMVKAGAAVDAVVDQLLSLLSPGDLIIDGGNSHFLDTERRTQLVTDKGLLYIGTGVSGGEEGARHGPSIMPGGGGRSVADGAGTAAVDFS